MGLVPPPAPPRIHPRPSQGEVWLRNWGAFTHEVDPADQFEEWVLRDTPLLFHEWLAFLEVPPPESVAAVTSAYLTPSERLGWLRRPDSGGTLWAES